MSNNFIKTDFLIIGAGLAGLYAALTASEFGSVIVLSKGGLIDSNSWMAQGGIASVFGEGDAFDMHYTDTIKAGRDLCDENMVNIMVREGKERVDELIKNDMNFDKVEGILSLGLEGGHSARRILHADGSSTGRSLIEFLKNKIKSKANILIMENTHCIELIGDDGEVFGAYAHHYSDNSILVINSKTTLIASGGYAKIYKRTTNSPTAVGEGISIAVKSGAIIKDMEFVQFHPTAFYTDHGDSFLISEAVRGEGAYLLNKNSERFMEYKHELKELAPRDIVSKAIFGEMKNTESENVYLDLRHLMADNIKKRFPNIFRNCLKYGIDMRRDLIPVAPAAHYSIGGIVTDEFGRTNIKRLYSCGEASSTGVHGANRLASNSLLECLVFAKRAILKASEELSDKYSILNRKKSFRISKSSISNYIDVKNRIQNIFFQNAGIIKSGESLQNAMEETIKIQNRKIPNEEDIGDIKTSGLLCLSQSVLFSAIARKESRGTHQRSDFTETSELYLGNFYINKGELKFIEKQWKLKKII
jgi:L-aspartate oxidase